MRIHGRRAAESAALVEDFIQKAQEAARLVQTLRDEAKLRTFEVKGFEAQEAARVDDIEKAHALGNVIQEADALGLLADNKEALRGNTTGSGVK